MTAPSEQSAPGNSGSRAQILQRIGSVRPAPTFHKRVFLVDLAARLEHSRFAVQFHIRARAAGGGRNSGF